MLVFVMGLAVGVYFSAQIRLAFAVAIAKIKVQSFLKR